MRTSEAFKPQYVILCDDIREEVSGKVTLVGAYAEKIVIDKPEGPFVLPICFLIYGHVSGRETTSLQLWLENPDGSQNHEVAYDEIGAPGTDATEPAMVMWKVVPWMAPAFGEYKLHLKQGARSKTIYKFRLEPRSNERPSANTL